jgi:hypothetical protein
MFVRPGNWTANSDVDAPVHPHDERLLEKLQNRAATVALYFMYHNVARVQQALRVTPAMEAGIADSRLKH